MKLTIIAIGRVGKDPEADIIDRYLKRLPKTTQIIELEERRPIKGDERKKREGEKILAAIPDGSFVVALDERGKQLRSTQFAQKCAQWQDSHGHITFLIGGADGFSQDVFDRAESRLSFSDMTWPHMMVRAMLIEQLYRASTILSGHPYHKD